MTTTDDDTRGLAGLRLIVLALLIGSTAVVGVLIFSATRMNNPIAPGEVPVYVFLGVGVFGLVLNLFAMPAAARKIAAGNLEATTPFKRYSATVFVRAAAAEGFLLLSGIGYLLTGNPFVLLPAVGHAAILGSLLPTAGKLRAFDDPVPTGAEDLPG